MSNVYPKAESSLIISLQDMERIESLLDTLPSTSEKIKEALLNELGRAVIVGSHEMPSSVVTMNSKVRFTIEKTQEEFCLTLVYPRDADWNDETISIFSPVGSALLGLSVGSKIEWPSPGGEMLTIKILEVIYQPEHAGKLYR